MAYFEEDGDEYDMYTDAATRYDTNAGMYLPESHSEETSHETSHEDGDAPTPSKTDTLPSVQQSELSLLLSGEIVACDFSSSPAYARVVPNWNAEFQQLYHQRDSVEKFEQLAALATDFVHAAEQYAKIIVSERALPPERKTIKSVDIGGVAGGVKYICQGILFKFAIDFEGIYRSTEGAAKAAGHDLNGLMAYLNCDANLLHVPLLAVIDYRGYRVVAVSMLPIARHTLCYGSCDGARTVFASYPKVNEAMRQCALKMNIRGHLCGEVDPKLIHGPADIEVHAGRDNRFYILDFARYMPCEPPSSQSDTNTALYRLLRPELVRSNGVPLSPDAFSRMTSSSEDGKAHRRDVREAFERLRQEVIPQFARTIAEDPEVANLSSLMHAAGINMRHLGWVSAELSSLGASESARRTVLIEAISRIVKIHIRSLWRERAESTLVPSETPFRRVVVDFANMFLGNSEESMAKHKQYWDSYLPVELEKTFEGITSGLENTTIFEFLTAERTVSRLNWVLLKAFENLGVKLSAEVTDLLRSGFDVHLVDPEITSIDTRSKHINIIHYSEAMALLFASRRVHDDNQAIRMLDVAERRLELSLKQVQSSLFKLRLAHVALQKCKRGDSNATKMLLKAHKLMDELFSHGETTDMMVLRMCSKVITSSYLYGGSQRSAKDLFSLADISNTAEKSVQRCLAVPEDQWAKDIIDELLLGISIIGKLSLTGHTMELFSQLSQKRTTLRKCVNILMRLQRHPLDSESQYSLYMSLFRLHWSYYLSFQEVQHMTLANELELYSFSSVPLKLQFVFLAEASKNLNKAATLNDRALAKAVKSQVIASEMRNYQSQVRLSVLPGLVQVSSLLLEYVGDLMASECERGIWWKYCLDVASSDFGGFISLVNTCRVPSVDLLYSGDPPKLSILRGPQITQFLTDCNLDNLQDLRLPHLSDKEFAACAPLIRAPNLEYLDLGSSAALDENVELILQQCPAINNLDMYGCVNVTTGCVLNLLSKDTIAHLEVPISLNISTLCSADLNEFQSITHLALCGTDPETSHALLLMKGLPNIEVLSFEKCRGVSSTEVMFCQSFAPTLRRVYGKSGLCMLFGPQHVVLNRNTSVTRVSRNNQQLYTINQFDAFDQLALARSDKHPKPSGHSFMSIQPVGNTVMVYVDGEQLCQIGQQFNKTMTTVNLHKQSPLNIKHSPFAHGNREQPWNFAGGTKAIFPMAMRLSRKMELAISGTRCATLEIILAYTVALHVRKIF